MTKRLYIFLASVVILGLFPTVAIGSISEIARSQSKRSNSDSITVSGCVRNIKGRIPRTVIINECDVSDKSVKEICELDSNNSFCRKIPLSYPHTFTVNYNKRNFINAFAAPGDSIFMDIDASTSPLSVNFSGDKAEINNQYDSAFQYLNSFYGSVNLPADTTVFDEFMPVFKEYVKAGQDNSESYAQVHKLSDEVRSMLYADNIYVLANFALGYRGRNIEEKRAFFLDPIFDIFNEENTRVMIYPYHISAIMQFFPDVRDKAPKGTARDIMYACDEDAQMPDRSVFINQNYYDRLYSPDITAKEVSIDGIGNGNICIYINGEFKDISEENPLEWLVTEYKGQPIYLDVSATWCGPCRAGLKGSEFIRNHFKDTDIKFAVLWLRSSKEDWLKIAPTISNCIQIFINNTELDDRIIGSLGITGFPTYIMIGKDGKLTKDGVSRYLSPELIDYLNSYK